MNYLKEHGRWIAVCMAAWCISKTLFISIKLWGIESMSFGMIGTNMGLLVSAVALSGLVDGLIIGFIDTEFDSLIKQTGFYQRVILKSIVNMVVGLTLTVVFVPLLIGWSPESGVMMFSRKLITANIIIMTVYVFVITLLLQLLKVAATWIQTNDLRQILSEKNDGIEEDRIFMFLDMKSSTTHAEKLGAARYSMLVQDCFLDMTKAARLSNAEIYQFVGDEAVFTWMTSQLNLAKAVQHYFDFKHNMQLRSAHYRHHYGIVPEFKAGVHHGRVIRTQVGVVRKSIAFHGDAINTASRIQGKCNELECGLLVSGAIKEQLHANFITRPMGTYQLKGKDCKVSLYSIKDPAKVKSEESRLVGSRQNIQCTKARLPLFRLWLNTL